MEQRTINIGALLTEKNRENDPTPENFQPFRKESSTLEVLGASFSRAFEDTATQLIQRKIRREFDTDTNVLQPNDLNERFPGMPQPFNEPMSLSVAESMAQTQRRRKQLDDIIANGDTDSTIQKYGGFVASLGAHIIDPVGMAVGGVIGKGLGWVASKALTKVGTSGLASKALTGLQQNTLKAQVAEGAIGGGFEEVALAQPLLEEELQDEMTTTDLAVSVAAGGLFPIGLRGASKLSQTTFNFLKGGKRGTEKVTNALHVAEGQLENGKRVSTDDYVNAEYKKELPDLKEELETARQNGDTARVDELTETVRTAEEAPTPDRTESLRRNNGKESDLGYDPEVDQIVKTNLDNPVVPDDLTPEITQKFQELDERVSRIDLENMPEEFRLEIETARNEFNNVETFDKAYEQATSCVRSA